MRSERPFLSAKPGLPQALRQSLLIVQERRRGLTGAEPQYPATGKVTEPIQVERNRPRMGSTHHTDQARDGICRRRPQERQGQMQIGRSNVAPQWCKRLASIHKGSPCSASGQSAMNKRNLRDAAGEACLPATRGPPFACACENATTIGSGRRQALQQDHRFGRDTFAAAGKA